MKQNFENFEAFFLHYMELHSKPITRWIHVTFTLIGASFIVTMIVMGLWKWLWLTPFIIYLPLFGSHFIFEKNHPATFSHPLWSVRADLRMIRQTLMEMGKFK